MTLLGLDPATSASGAARPRTAAITNLGCRVNQAEMEAAVRLLRSAGVRIVDDDEPADLVLVNTCTVTAVADAKSRQMVRRARRRSPDATLVVTGCAVAVDPAAFARVDPAARLVGNEAKEALLAELAALVGIEGLAERGPSRRALPTLSGVEAVDGDEQAAGAPPPAAGERTRAFVKVQDGCSFFCTYCIIPRARGPERSLPPEAVLADVRRALAAGHREIVLTGVNIGTYDGGWSERGPRGSHRRAACTLAGLVRRILAETEVERIRLSSIEPQHVTDELLEVWTRPGAGRCLPHFHLPLQSGDDGVLRRMGRRYDSAFYAGLVERIRRALPGVAIHADVIVGFPTEDEAAFERSVAFIRGLDPAGLHVFRYSVRPGTPAARMVGQVDEGTKRARAEVLLRFAAEARARFAARSLGSTARVLFETPTADGRWLGRSEANVLVLAASRDGRSLENAIGRVVLEAVDETAPDRVQGRVLGLLPPPSVRHSAA
ncbi:MAG TPA: tRNA (N(6)-L-threonylcarbamoyladenosine(37)-C(2))-methylthiotransferase MtaB [Candidatus Binatia bacterium]|nr:tRNA (N(6)-L-threonylcarbamoyladenosine(37)-C(2))-methylthiotransferase MtaB [Candidatus Binatia bacterium]